MLGVLLLKGVGQLDDESGQAALAGLKDPAFGFGETGEIDMHELVESALGLGKARLDLARSGTQG
jgi:hypothetical protein